MTDSMNRILIGLLIGSPATILTLGLLLNSYNVEAITTTIVTVFLFILILFITVFYWIYNLNKRLKNMEEYLNEDGKKE